MTCSALSNNNHMIVIESELGCRADEIGKSLAERLHTRSFGQEILSTAAEISGISEKQLRRYDGRTVRCAYDLLSEDIASIMLPQLRQFIVAKIAACRMLAQEHPGCVLVDRHAGLAASRSSQIRIFLHGDKAQREKNYDLLPQNDDPLRKMSFQRANRSYRSLYRDSDSSWGHCNTYDLVLDVTGRMPEAIADEIAGKLSALQTETAEAM